MKLSLTWSVNLAGKTFQWNKVKLTLLRRKISIWQKIKLTKRKIWDKDRQGARKQDRAKEEFHSRKEMKQLVQLGNSWVHKIPIHSWIQTLIWVAKISKILKLFLLVICKISKIKIVWKWDSVNLIYLLRGTKIKSQMFIIKLQRKKLICFHVLRTKWKRKT